MPLTLFIHKFGTSKLTMISQQWELQAIFGYHFSPTGVPTCDVYIIYQYKNICTVMEFPLPDSQLSNEIVPRFPHEGDERDTRQIQASTARDQRQIEYPGHRRFVEPSDYGIGSSDGGYSGSTLEDDYETVPEFSDDGYGCRLPPLNDGGFGGRFHGSERSEGPRRAGGHGYGRSSRASYEDGY